MRARGALRLLAAHADGERDFRGSRLAWQSLVGQCLDGIDLRHAKLTWALLTRISLPVHAPRSRFPLIGYYRVKKVGEGVADGLVLVWEPLVQPLAGSVHSAKQDRSHGTRGQRLCLQSESRHAEQCQQQADDGTEEPALASSNSSEGSGCRIFRPLGVGGHALNPA